MLKIATPAMGAALGTLAVTLLPAPGIAGQDNRDWSIQAGAVTVTSPQDREYTVHDREYSMEGTRVTGVSDA